MTRRVSLVAAFLLALSRVSGQSAASAASTPATVEKTPDGVLIARNGAWLDLRLRADNIVRVASARDRAFFSSPSLDVVPATSVAPHWNLTQTTDTATLTTAKLRVQVDLPTGTVKFFDAAGLPILAEVPGGRTMEAVDVQGDHTFHIRQQWAHQEDESLYGLGQQQLGIVDLKGFDLDLWQHNTNVVVPFLVSSKGYGILWDNLSYSRFGDLRPFEAIPASVLLDSSGQPGGLTRGTFTPASPNQLNNPTATALLTSGGTRGRIELPVGGNIDTSAGANPGAARGRGARGGAGPTYTRWVGQIAPTITGDYQFQTYANGGIKVWIDDKLVIDRWRQNWLTERDVAKIHLEAGRKYTLKMESGGDQTTTASLLWKTPAPSADTSLWSEVGEGEDYYFVYGPNLDQVVAGYRLLTGQAAMMPQWAFGLWQSRQRYETAQASLDVVNQFRIRKIPFDNIVQDWMYWPENAWGSHQFDPARFPDPEGWIKSIHDLHAHLMISVWGKFYPTTGNAKAMQDAGYLYQPTLTANTHDWVGRGGYNYTFYDAFNPAARNLFWNQMNSGLFSKHVDAWWMDATEPDVVQPSPATLAQQKQAIGVTALGTASRVLNGYALMNSAGIYEGQRAAAPDQRVFILTRSGFAGQQRYGAVTWSGDITSTWTSFARQIPAGLGFSISGVPYWTTDTGGYTMETRFSTANPTPENLEEWRELNARWFEYSTFTPVLRVHGELKNREMWNIGDETTPVFKAELKFDQLRYALFPYIYSLAGDVAQNAGTMMRPFVMDFPQDAAAREITDEYMFGPAFLVAPVTKYQARSRSVYLPAGAVWLDYWTGQPHPGGQTIDAPAPYDAMPLFVRAGSIIPFGPDVQYVGEKPAESIKLKVYAGADGKFTLYEDDGLTYEYEKGAFSQIPITWDDAAHTLTIGQRTGTFKGMMADRTFVVEVIPALQPGGPNSVSLGSISTPYHGVAVVVKAPVVGQ